MVWQRVQRHAIIKPLLGATVFCLLVTYISCFPALQQLLHMIQGLLSLPQYLLII